MRRSHMAKLTDERVEEIYIELRDGTPIKDIADKVVQLKSKKKTDDNKWYDE